MLLAAAEAALFDLESAQPPDQRPLDEVRAENARLRTALSRLAFRPLPGGVKTPAQAAFVLALPGVWGLEEASVQTRYRLLVGIFHPDAGLLPDAERLRQVTDARNILLRHLQQG